MMRKGPAHVPRDLLPSLTCRRSLWLNEGFATWMETGVCAELYPKWSMWEQFITDMQGRALQLDALRSSHPIQVPIKKAEEVEQVFDAISYCKGGFLLPRGMFFVTILSVSPDTCLHCDAY